MSPAKPPPKRARSSREPWQGPRDHKELLKAIGAGTAVVLLSAGAVLFLGRDQLGGDDATPVAPVPTSPAGTDTTPTVPTTPIPATPPTDPSPPAGETLTP